MRDILHVLTGFKYTPDKLLWFRDLLLLIWFKLGGPEPSWYWVIDCYWKTVDEIWEPAVEQYSEEFETRF